MGRGQTKTSTSATHTCGQARTTLCIEVEKESTRKSVLRKVVEHFPLNITEDNICVGRRQTKAWLQWCEVGSQDLIQSIIFNLHEWTQVMRVALSSARTALASSRHGNAKEDIINHEFSFTLF